MSITVGQLWHHPVKSMQGEAVDEVFLGPEGLVGDRAYGLLDLETDRLVSAKHPKKYAAILTCKAVFAEPPSIDAAPPAVTVTFPDGTVVDGDEETIAAKASELLGRPVKFVSQVPEGVAYEEVWPELEGFGPDDFYGMLQLTPGETDEAGERILGIPSGMAAKNKLLDLAAMHVMSTSTLATLGAEYPEGDWDVRRFRPNILFDDGDEAGAYGEDEWVGSDLLIGGRTRIHIVAPTVRCIMPTLAQPGLERDHGILRTMAKANVRELGPLGKFACAGAYAEVVTPGPVRVGDTVDVVETEATGSPLGDAVAMIQQMKEQAAG